MLEKIKCILLTPYMITELYSQMQNFNKVEYLLQHQMRVKNFSNRVSKRLNIPEDQRQQKKLALIPST
jgi:hypothetical protein